MEALRTSLFSDGGYSPHGFCIARDSRLLYTQIAADLLIALSYFAIPLLIVIFLRRRQDPSLSGPAVLFAAFITLCGLSHLSSIVTIYLPSYGVQGLLKLTTGIVSFVTALALYKLLPQVSKIPSVSRLQKVIAERDAELAQRRSVEADLEVRGQIIEAKRKALATASEELERFSCIPSFMNNEPALCLDVSDNGIGIDPAHHHRVHSLFERLHRAQDYPGTGLGLALCRRVAVSHGGTPEIRSELKTGTEIAITIPQEITAHVANAA